MQSASFLALLCLCLCSALASSRGVSPLYGRVVTIGDSMFNRKEIYIQTLENLLDTTAVCNARSGAPVGSIARQSACSQDSECKWSVINDAPGAVWKKDGWQKAFEALVDREIAAARKVIIVGYPLHGSVWKTESMEGHDYTILMNKYEAIASTRADVWFIDPRENPVYSSSWDYFAGDKRHPSAKGTKVFATSIAELIKSQTLPTTLTTTPCPGQATCTTTTTTITTTPVPQYYQLEKGSCCCPVQERISTQAECERAHESLGLKRDMSWSGTHSSIPGGCSTRQDHSHNLHWNTEVLGVARSDLTAICKKPFEDSEEDASSRAIIQRMRSILESFRTELNSKLDMLEDLADETVEHGLRRLSISAGNSLRGSVLA